MHQVLVLYNEGFKTEKLNYLNIDNKLRQTGKLVRAQQNNYSRK